MANYILYLLEIMEKLRSPDHGCPWDMEQTFSTIVRHTIEEAYEVAEAIERGDFLSLKEELGDLLFQIVFYAQLANEQKLFDFNDIAEAICLKMKKRNPHVFGETRIKTANEQTIFWEKQKSIERAEKSSNSGILHGVPITLPAITRAIKLQCRAANVGFDWPDAIHVVEKITEETEEVREEILLANSDERLEDEIGDLLFVCVNLARKLKIDPEGALRRANRKFERRFGFIEATLKSDGRHPEETSIEEMEALWKTAKQHEKDGTL